jgi:hypothetical protein
MDFRPEIEVQPDTIAAIVARYGLSTSTAARLSHAGTSNTIYLLGDAFVLRVPRNDPSRFGPSRGRGWVKQRLARLRVATVFL